MATAAIKWHDYEGIEHSFANLPIEPISEYSCPYDGAINYAKYIKKLTDFISNFTDFEFWVLMNGKEPKQETSHKDIITHYFYNDLSGIERIVKELKTEEFYFTGSLCIGMEAVSRHLQGAEKGFLVLQEVAENHFPEYITKQAYDGTYENPVPFQSVVPFLLHRVFKEDAEGQQKQATFRKIVLRIKTAMLNLQYYIAEIEEDVSAKLRKRNSRELSTADEFSMTKVAKWYSQMHDYVMNHYEETTDVYKFFAEAGDLEKWIIHSEWGVSFEFDELGYCERLSKMSISELIEEYDNLEPGKYLQEHLGQTLHRLKRMEFCEHFIGRTVGEIVSYDRIFAETPEILEDDPSFRIGALMAKKKMLLFREWVYRHWDDKPKEKSYLIFKQENIVPVVTPFKEDAEGIEIDEAAIGRLLDHLASIGVRSILVMGATGEFTKLPNKMRVKGIELFAKYAQEKGISIFANATANTETDTINNIKQIEKMRQKGLDCIKAVVIAPLYYLDKNEDIIPHVEKLEKEIGSTYLPWVFYNNPGIVESGDKNIDPDIVAELRYKIPAMKDSSGNLVLLGQYASYVRTYQGDEGQILPALQRGAVGSVASMGNVLPEPQKLFDPLTKRYQGDLQAAIIEYRPALTANLNKISGALKYYLSLLGVCSDRVVSTGKQLNDAEKKEVKNVLSDPKKIKYLDKLARNMFFTDPELTMSRLELLAQSSFPGTRRYAEDLIRLLEIRVFKEAVRNIHTHLPSDIGSEEVKTIVNDMDTRLRNSIGAKFHVKKTIDKIKNTDIIHYKLPYGGPMTVIGYGKEDNRRYTLIDTGMGIYYQDMKKQLIQDGIKLEQIERILILHYDMDHASGAGYFQRDFPNIKIHAHEKWYETVRNRQPNDPAGAAYSAIARKLFDYKHPPRGVMPYGECAKDIAIGEKVLGIDHGQALPVLGEPFICGDLSLTVIESCTHTVDYVYIADVDNGLLFTGEPMNEPAQTLDEAAMLIHQQILHSYPTVHYARSDFVKDNRTFRSDSRFTTRYCGHDEPVIENGDKAKPAAGTEKSYLSLLGSAA